MTKFGALDNVASLLKTPKVGISSKTAIDRILVKPQLRKEFDPEALSELQQSIEVHGLLQPVVVVKIKDDPDHDFLLVAGERRYRSCKALGWATIPYVLRELTEFSLADFDQIYAEHIVPLQGIENIHHEPFNLEELADLVARTVKKFDGNQSKAAKELGKSEAYVSRHLHIHLDPVARKLAAGQPVTSDPELVLTTAAAIKAEPAMASDFEKALTEGNLTRETVRKANTELKKGNATGAKAVLATNRLFKHGPSHGSVLDYWDNVFTDSDRASVTASVTRATAELGPASIDAIADGFKRKIFSNTGLGLLNLLDYLAPTLGIEDADIRALIERMEK